MEHEGRAKQVEMQCIWMWFSAPFLRCKHGFYFSIDAVFDTKRECILMKTSCFRSKITSQKEKKEAK